MRRACAASAAVALLFLLVSARVLPDYGPMLDSPKNWAEGDMNLKAPFGAPVDRAVLEFQKHGALVFMASSASKKLLSDELGWLEPMTARHAVLPLLTAGFLFLLCLFLETRAAPGVGIVAAAALATYPEFFGLAFNNLKDGPLVEFSALALLAYCLWRTEGKLWALYAFYASLGAALDVKIYALYVPGALLLWEAWMRDARGRGRLRAAPAGSWRHHAGGLLLIAAMLALFYVPALYFSDVTLRAWLSSWGGWAKGITVTPADAQGSWGFYGLEQLAVRAPLPLLAAAFCGGSFSLLRRPGDPLRRLLLLALVLPLIPPCLPGLYIYQSGMRLFLVFVAPLAILGALGVFDAAKALARAKGPAYERRAAGLLAAVVLGANAAALLTMHPYEICYFNELAGGLRGAQAADIPYSFDHMGISYRAAGRWLDEYVEPGAAVLAVQDANWNFHLLDYCLKRKDIRLRYVDNLDELAGDGPIAPGTYLTVFWDFLAGAPDYELVYRVERQGGHLFSIYRKRAAAVRPASG